MWPYLHSQRRLPLHTNSRCPVQTESRFPPLVLDNFMHKEDLHRYMVSGYIGYTIVSIGTVCFVEYLRVVSVAVLTTSGTKMGLFSYVLLHVYTFACAALSDTLKRWS